MSKRTMIDNIFKLIVAVPVIGFAYGVITDDVFAMVFFLGMLIILEILLGLSFFIDN